MRKIWGGSVLVVVIAAACAGGTEDGTSEGTAAISFPAGYDDGYCASNPGPSCTHGTPVSAKQLVLTFDDGPGSLTVDLSHYLKSQGIRATFFVTGSHLGASPGTILSQLMADGHLVANHTQSHPDMRTLGDSAIVSEVTLNDALIGPYIASKHSVFRAPFGYWNAHTYDILHASPMDKYVGPVKWDVGGTLSPEYAADWDCWQNQSGNGVKTSKQCGENYIREVNDVGRGIVLMHDADYGDITNHNATSGMGNTVDMVKYMVPLLKVQGYSFLRVDEVPDIAAAFRTTPSDAGADSGATCAFNPTWQQTSYANEWWVEYAISGSVASAFLEVVGGANVPLANNWGKWVGPTTARIPMGTQVVVHAKNSANQGAQTKPLSYLVSLTPVTACSASSDAGADASLDAGVGTDAGCGSSFNPTWSQGSGANNWWVEYAIKGTTTITGAHLEVPGDQTVTLSLRAGKWVGPPAKRVATGALAIVHAQDAAGHRAQTAAFAYLSVKTPVTEACAR